MSTEPEKPDFFVRLYRALGPLAGGLLLDFADLATFGPTGFFAGPFIGVAIAFWICSIYRFSFWTKVMLSLLAGLYCAVPMTEPLPLATLITAACRFFESPPSPPSSSSGTSGQIRKKVDSTIIENDDEDTA